MTKAKVLFLIAAAVVAARCATAPPPPAPVTGEDRFLIDPRTGATTQLPPSGAKRFDAAWRFIQAGNESEAVRRLDQIARSAPDYLPVSIARAALDIRAGRLAAASKAVKAALEASKDYTAARVYQAEITIREKKLRTAFDLYTSIAAGKDAPPTAAPRLAEVRARLFEEIWTAAQSASGDDDAIRLLREALTLSPDAFQPRILLADKLLGRREFDEARKEIDPLLDSFADRTEVQVILAEVDAGKGRFEEAIVRYERIARRSKDERHAARLDALKREWSAVNMPGYYRSALASPAVTREQFAVLLYWTVPTVRFARNLGTPPIATDVPDLEGREEVIRAIAIGLFDVDPITRLVQPDRVIPAERLAKHLARVLRGTPCAQGLAWDKALAACGVDVPIAGHADDDPVTGAETLRALEQVAKATQ